MTTQQSNDLIATQQAIGHFNTAETAAGQIYNSVDGAIAQLTGGAMVSQSGAIFAGSIGEWLTQFRVVSNTLQQFQANLSTTLRETQANEEQNINAVNAALNPK